MRPDRPSLTAAWVAAHRLKLAASRPTIAGGNVQGERDLYESMSRLFIVPGLRPTGMAVRTQFVDAEVVKGLGEGITQFVLVGAGYDGRALRFGTTTTHWIEIDHPATQAEKRRRLDDLGVGAEGMSFAPVDLTKGDLDAQLAVAGHRLNEPSLFICEGLFSYLSEDDVLAVLRTLRTRSAPRSVLAATFLVEPAGGLLAKTLTGAVDAVLSAIGEARGSRYRPSDPERLLEDAEWDVVRRATSRPNRINAGSHLLAIAAEAAGSD